ncbi:MAG TPA: hypothetical protein VI282_04185 [Verrucomicrobiae bacterium]|jgi:hypothetical protein
MRCRIALLIVCLSFGCATTPDSPTRGDMKPEVNLETRGYVRTEASGTWKYGFERSEFVPVDRPKEKWWLKLPSRWWDENKSSPVVKRGIEQDGATVRVSGLLSPTGKFGHLGAYNRELVVEKIDEVSAR